MTVREKIVARANAILGMSRNQLGLSGSFAWCAATVSGVLEYCGVKGVSSYSCNEMYKLMTKSSAWDEPDSNPIASDVILFDWNDPSNPDPDQSYLPLDHVGIVVDFNPNTGIITYINGNGNSSVYVTKQTIHVNNRCVAHWMRYIGNGKEVTPTSAPKPVEKKYCTVTLEQLSKGCKSASVETLQNLLNDLGYNLRVDGDFGSGTENAVIDFQKANGLEVDGCVGSATWKKLVEAE